MPNRGLTSYRYGFNNKEIDSETKGTGNSYDFGARIYDPRLGRWLSTDPLQEKFPYATPYNFALNNPVLYVDYDGRDIIIGYSVDKRRIEALIGNVFAGKIKAEIYQRGTSAMLKLSGDVSKLSEPERKIYDYMQQIITNGNERLYLDFRDKELEPFNVGVDDFHQNEFYLNRAEAHGIGLDNGGSGYDFVHYMVEQYGNQVLSANSVGDPENYPGPGHYNTWKVKRGGNHPNAKYEGWHEFAVRYTMGVLNIGSSAASITSEDGMVNDVDLADGDGNYKSTLRTHLTYNKNTKKYEMKASTFIKAGAEPGKTKIDINKNTSFYETHDQWSARLKSEGRDPNNASYYDEQTAEYFKRNPVKK